MYLVLKNKAVVTPMDVILKTLQRELTNGKLKDIGHQRAGNIPVTCPSHKDGFESHPSCNVFADLEDKETQYGQVHCFTCGYTRTLPQFIADCFDEEDESFGEEWLLSRCETAFISQLQYLPEIELSPVKEKPKHLDESVLKAFNYYHDYMWYRKLSREVVDLFEVGYDPNKEMITFPVRDEKGRLLFITGRSVKTKRFEIPDEVKKPIYLLYYILQNNITNVAVVESQLNALYLWSIGMPAICLFGTGSGYQYELLKKSGIRVFNLFFDGDEAGRKGASRFKYNMPKDLIVNTFILPDGKDVNDLTAEEVYNLRCF